MQVAPLLHSFILVSLAEIGDKTQLATIILASRNKPLPVFLGGVSGFLLTDILSILIGLSIKSWIPISLFKVLSASMFFIFGFLSLIERREKISIKSYKTAFLTAFFLITSMELADKTNLVVIALVIEYPTLIQVIAGITLAAITMMGLSVIAGSKLRCMLPSKWLRMGSALAFILFGFYMILELFGIKFL